LASDDSAVEGPVGGTVTSDEGAMLYAGVNDDPFFFDIAGLQDTLATGTLSFDSSRDRLAGLNVTAIVAEMPLSELPLGEAGSFQVWATTGRQ
jgi:hypothetical protein